MYGKSSSFFAVDFFQLPSALHPGNSTRFNLYRFCKRGGREVAGKTEPGREDMLAFICNALKTHLGEEPVSPKQGDKGATWSLFFFFLAETLCKWEGGVKEKKL